MEHQNVDVLIIGAGLSGISAAVHLSEGNAGASYAILERRARIGGTWDLFRYPGIRSDSDMYTFGYRFRAWRGTKVLAGGADIRRYVQETAEAHDVARHIRFGRRAVSANWSSESGRWTVTTVDEATGERELWSARFLVGATGYYDYDAGHRPELPGDERFGGAFVHPQHWPEDLDYAGKRVVVIGSGATAITLVPSMAAEAAHVTMLQRSPTYILTLPEDDPVSVLLRKLRVPASVVHRVGRARNIALQRGLYALCRKAPRLMRRVLLGAVRAQVGKSVDMRHFTPTYKPWDQRLCVVPNGDLFKTLKSGAASVVTDHIETFTETGVKVRSGEEIPADIVITATGLRVQLVGGMEIAVDGEPVNPHDHVLYKGVMLDGVPNLAIVIGYTNASWTLKADLAAEYLSRLIAYMDGRGLTRVTPVATAADRSEASIMGESLTSGYIARGDTIMPRQGTRAPWRIWNNYYRDRKALRRAPVEDPALRFERAVPSAERPATERDRSPAA
ncbi:flavin-containing monooxygenase [Streptomyces cavernicola]|uniref:NAD(P)/FAD-dependent oxidoreductase n=1 Tax=Streptomyces cavernicola TaxID=3043613 RepID=A0ABT6SL72_9ACTN|nr:NAD(P)/FAD-dependent oxidoreductase [Streptomyces sp. B-S-A6]MDI3408143.1 NAD(P)/FAD-dependent oxidoreductase [Streptomyces sp. B-S-A6]